MPGADPAATERRDAVAEETSAYLDTARGIARQQFGQQAIDDIPLLVVQIAQIMVTLDVNRQARKDE